ncbi:MAG: flavodoxin family protein [Clostridiales bacterium]|nr:flavodoxin family protein [Candidatus Crickella merdequi]
MKISVIYDSRTGTTKTAADYIAEGIAEAGLEAKTFGIDKTSDTAVLEYIKASKGVIIGSPTYSAQTTAAMLTWLQSEAGKLELAGKLGGAYATEQYVHGGAENVISSILTNEMCKGMMTYSGGSALGKPVIHLGPVGMSQDIESFRELFNIYGKRFAEQVSKVFK